MRTELVTSRECFRRPASPLVSCSFILGEVLCPAVLQVSQMAALP